MDLFRLAIFVGIVAGTLLLLVLAGRWDRRARRAYESDLRQAPLDPIDRAVHKRDENNPLAQTRTVLGPVFPVNTTATTAQTPQPSPATSDVEREIT